MLPEALPFEEQARHVVFDWICIPESRAASGVAQEAERELARSRKELKLKSIAFQNLKAKQDAGRDPLMRRAAAGEATPAPPQSERVATTVRPQSAAATTAGRGRVPPPLVIPADSAEVRPILYTSPAVQYLLRTSTSTVRV
jgi:DNA-binding protein H-NS